MDIVFIRQEKLLLGHHFICNRDFCVFGRENLLLTGGWHSYGDWYLIIHSVYNAARLYLQ